MKHLPQLIFIFALAFAFFLLAPALLSEQFGLFPLMKVGDIVDLFTPLVLIPLYWLLFQFGGDQSPSVKCSIIFMVLTALWVEGQGMHLAANSIGHLLGGLEGSDIYTLTKFYDEHLSHWLWHSGIIGLSTILIVRSWRHLYLGQESKLTLETIAGIIYGITFFIAIVEGGTVPLGLPYTILVTLFGLIWGRKVLRQQPILAFSTVGYGLGTLLFIAWGIYWGGFPQFSEVGIIQ
jgi:hypothetical protein